MSIYPLSIEQANSADPDATVTISAKAISFSATVTIVAMIKEEY